MIGFEQMTARLAIAFILGMIVGFERGLVGKEAGIRTQMLVSGGAAVFTMIALALPYLVAAPGQNPADVIAGSTFMNIISTIIVGIGFIGGGIIIKTGEHVVGLTSAAVVWFTAGIGILVGLGMISFAIIATLLATGLLYLLRRLKTEELIKKEGERINR